MSHVLVAIVFLVIGWLDPIVIWRKANELGEKGLFPKLENLRKEWREKKPSETTMVESEKKEE